MRHGIGLTIAVACAVAAYALPGVALPRALATGPAIPVSRGPSASPTASSPEAASLQGRLTTLLDGTLGPGNAAVTVDAILKRNRVNAQSLRYARRGVAVQSRSARTQAGGYSARSAATTWAHSATVTRTAFATGGVRQLHIGLMVDTTVPRAIARRLARTVAVAAGLRRTRGDTLALTRARCAPRRPAATATRLPPAALRWALLALGVVAFLFSFTPARRESALI